MADSETEVPLAEAAAPEPTTATSVLLRPWRLVARLIGAAVVLLWLTGAILRLTLRDQLPLLSVLFYGTPPAVLAASALLAGCFLFLVKLRRLAFAAAVAGLLCALWWWQTSFYYHQPTTATAKSDLRVLFWNCRRGHSGWKPIAEEIQRIDAPLIGLVEAGAITIERPEFWRRKFLDYDVATPGGGIVLMTRGKILQSRLLPLANGGLCGEFEIESDGRRVIVFVVDMTSNLFVSRRPAHRALVELIGSKRDQPLLIVGDFNTPTESICTEELRRVCRNAFETAGRGNYATWPLPIPVLPLDQVWLNDRLRAVRCRHLWTSNSDHRPVVTELSILPDARLHQTSP